MIIYVTFKRRNRQLGRPLLPIYEYRIGRCVRGFLSARSRADARDTLRAALTCAVEEQIISCNLVTVVKLPASRKYKRRWWTVDEAWSVPGVRPPQRRDALRGIRPDSWASTDDIYAAIDWLSPAARMASRRAWPPGTWPRRRTRRGWRSSTCPARGWRAAAAAGRPRLLPGRQERQAADRVRAARRPGRPPGMLPGDLRNNRGTHPGAISCRPIPPRPHTRTVRHCPKIVPSYVAGHIACACREGNNRQRLVSGRQVLVHLWHRESSGLVCHL